MFVSLIFRHLGFTQVNVTGGWEFVLNDIRDLEEIVNFVRRFGVEI
jgi:hypothetical protein